jgi:hypothetical protein
MVKAVVGWRPGLGLAALRRPCLSSPAVTLPLVLGGFRLGCSGGVTCAQTQGMMGLRGFLGRAVSAQLQFAQLGN